MCDERSQLFERYAAVVRAYSLAVTTAAHLKGVDFDEARGQLEELRKLSQQARKDVDQHEQTHGCRVQSVKAD